MPTNMPNSIFCIFPYLKTNQRLRLRGVEFRSSSDLDDLDAEARDHLKTLCAMFFLGDGVQIREMTCASIQTGGDGAYLRDTLRRVHDTRLLIGYLYSSPQPMGGVFLPSESSSLFVFRPDRVVSSLVWHELDEGELTTLLREQRKSETGFLEGYEGSRNDTAHFGLLREAVFFPRCPIKCSISHNVSLII